MSTLHAVRAAAYENPRPEVTQVIPRGVTRVLDLGCSSGALGAVLRQRDGAAVIGIERDPEYGARAAARLDRVLVADLEQLARQEPDSLRHDLGDFDCIVAADVLEHLVDPWSALRAFRPLLRPGGALVVSLPNVRYWESLWELGIRGTWPRRPEGIHDATHLRWFTLTDAYELIEGAGVRVEHVHRVIRLRPRRALLQEPSQALARVPVLRAFLTFQHVLRARRR